MMHEVSKLTNAMTVAGPVMSGDGCCRDWATGGARRTLYSLGTLRASRTLRALRTSRTGEADRTLVGASRACRLNQPAMRVVVASVLASALRSTTTSAADVCQSPLRLCRPR
jgi:hypothetical protein